ncbi:WXG100 family type VII secretion target [Streptomyces sp. NPDC088864]|uniref:WXG100 family type VII secretion target n=1 Tax=Streptomyces sp. NPDC088864 TaxID=3365910 RepID=UPI00381B787C
MGARGRLPALDASYDTTDFEHMPYEDMLRMIHGVDPAAIMDRGTALVDAQAELEKIGTELRQHVSRTAWHGKGGDAFHEWGDEFAKETLKLADYAGAAGTSLQTAGQALSEVTAAMRAHPEARAACQADPEKEKVRLEAVEKARNEAIPQMNKLASYYLMARRTLAEQEEPNFRPLPAEVMPLWPIDSWQSDLRSPGGDRVTSSASGAPPGAIWGSGSRMDSTRQAVDGSSSFARAPLSGPHQVPVIPGIPVATGTKLDAVMAPEASVSATPSTPGGPAQQSLASAEVNPSFPPPMVSSQPRSAGLGNGMRLALPARPVAGGSGGNSRLPVTARADPGIHGGTPTRPVTSHGLMGSHGIGAVGAPMGRGTTGSSQRLTTRPGGTVRTPRATGAGREFTPGGSGLVQAVAGTGPGRRTQGDGAIPGYLTEDEEIWSRGDGGVVPPVIG